MNCSLIILKISLIVSDLSISGAGRWGGAVRPFLLTQALQKLGHTVEIVGFIPEQSTAAECPPELSIQTLEAKPYPGFFQSARQLLQRLSGDLIYAYKLKPTSFGLGLLSRITTARPVLLDIDDWELSWHGGDDFRYRPSPKQLARDLFKPGGALRNPEHPLYLKWTEQWVRQANGVTVHTSFLQSLFGGTYVPNGKDVSLFDPNRYHPAASREKYGLSSYRVLMFPGAPRPYKGLEDILSAIDQLNEPDIRLVIVGGSPYDDYDEQLMQKWGRWMIKLPKRPYVKMPEVISAAHLITVPQRETPAAKAQFPLKLTDGMAMAKPILATRVGDIAEILGDTGYVVDPDQPTQLAEKINWIFQNMDQANERGRLARKRCIQNYSIDSMATILTKVLAPFHN